MLVNLYFIALVGLIGPATAFGDSAPIVDLGYAKYQGTYEEDLGIYGYYGLRYAAPPTGHLRWQAPVPIEKVYNASEHWLLNASLPGPQCIQTTPAWQLWQLETFESSPEYAGALSLFTSPNTFTGVTTNRTSDEDCLLLDVLVPESPQSNKLPVVVQIHGGGYVLGNSQSSAGDHFTSFSQGRVIYVQIQYRLGAYGFLSSAELREAGTANAGLLDQRAALEWVQRNIHKFGGDPDKVTVWGDSSGGGSVTSQLILYGGDPNPPFRAAIIEYPWWQPFQTDARLEDQYNGLLQLTGCTNMSCFRTVSPDVLADAAQEVLITAYEEGLYAFGDCYFGPSIDGLIIQDLPSNEFQNGRFSKVSTLVDHDTYEGARFVNFTFTDESQLAPTFETLWPLVDFNEDLLDELFDIYPLSAFGEQYFLDNPFIPILAEELIPSLANNSVFWQFQTIFGDYTVDCPTYFVAEALATAGQDVWKLKFRAGTQLHGASLAYLLGAPNDTAPVLSSQMKDYYLSFILDLDPNSVASVEKPFWIQYSKSTDLQVLQVYDTYFNQTHDADAWDGCLFFDENSGVSRN